MGVKVRNLSGFLDVERELSPTTSLIVYIKKAMRSPEIIFDRTLFFVFQLHDYYKEPIYMSSQK